jgi:putative membrane protein
MKTILASIVTILLLAWLVPSVSYSGWVALVVAAIVMAILDTLIRPILKILFLPINVVTLGLFGWVINAALLWLVTYLVPGFQIMPMLLLGMQLSQFMSLVVVSMLISLIQSFVRIFIK